jgi:hypothetical protein
MNSKQQPFMVAWWKSNPSYLLEKNRVPECSRKLIIP